MGWYKVHSSFLQDSLKQTVIDRCINRGHHKKINLRLNKKDLLFFNNQNSLIK